MTAGQNALYFILKKGWIFLLVAFLVVYASVFIEFGDGQVILKWSSQPFAHTWQKLLMLITGTPLILIMYFRFRINR